MSRWDSPPTTLLRRFAWPPSRRCRYQDQGRPFLAFVYGIASHKVADAHRAAARNRSEPTDVVPERFSLNAGPEQMAINSDSAARMTKLLSVLPEKQREILTLRIVVGLSAEETAEAVGSTPGAVPGSPSIGPWRD